MALPQKLLGELLGTFALVFTAIGSAAAGEGLLGQALANGLVLSVLVAAFAGISGAHFNPAVTLAFTSVGRSPRRDAAPYIATQLIAATLAAFAVQALYEGQTPDPVALGAALPASSATSPVAVILGEALLTFLLVIAIYGTVIDPRGAAAKIGGFGVGFAVAANILALGAVTGGSMNPARSFGPALMRGDFSLHACYWIGPIAGAMAGAWLYESALAPGLRSETSSRESE